MPNQRTWIGTNRFGVNHFNGVFYKFTSLPTFLSETGVNNLISGSTTPYPWERLQLEEIIALLFGI
jgi:hypothetical protein